MQKLPFAFLPLKKVELLERSVHSGQKLPLYISLEKAYQAKEESTQQLRNFYEIEIGLQFGKTILINTISRRHSQINNFNYLLEKSIAHESMIKHKPPPKRWKLSTASTFKSNPFCNYIYAFSQLWTLDFNLDKKRSVSQDSNTSNDHSSPSLSPNNTMLYSKIDVIANSQVMTIYLLTNSIFMKGK